MSSRAIAIAMYGSSSGKAARRRIRSGRDEDDGVGDVDDGPWLCCENATTMMPLWTDIENNSSAMKIDEAEVTPFRNIVKYTWIRQRHSNIREEGSN